jgi:hypothetical protein
MIRRWIDPGSKDLHLHQRQNSDTLMTVAHYDGIPPQEETAQTIVNALMRKKSVRRNLMAISTDYFHNSKLLTVYLILSFIPSGVGMSSAITAHLQTSNLSLKSTIRFLLYLLGIFFFSTPKNQSSVKDI